ncbi:hypothetical protein GCM10023340_38800 [Nocardioides marinquilinus]|uniref:Uncharacterized protein n=1 Tax=Nocardioides marinquilinus TaxID=1210400 RepID=A0ABP9Q069_9ACTN
MPVAGPSRSATSEATCEDCGRAFEAKRSTARFCSTTCRSRAARARKAAAESTDADQAAGKVEHELVKAVRAELVKAGADQSFSGQLALQLARKIANPDETGVTALSKELRTVMAAALAHVAPPAPGPDGGAGGDGAEDDEVTSARRAREAKLAAAGQAADRA